MLTPLRECARHDVPVMPNDRRRLIDRYLTIATKGGRIATGSWDAMHAEVEAEADNLDPVCELAVDVDISHRDLDSALQGLMEFHRFSGRGAVNSVARAVTQMGERFPGRVAVCMGGLGLLALDRSDTGTAMLRFEAALALFRRSGSMRGEASCICNLGEVALRRSDYGTAAAHFEGALALFRRTGDELGEAQCIRGLGEIALRLSDHRTAAARLESALALYQHRDGMLGEANCLHSLGAIAIRSLDYEKAADHNEAALKIQQRGGAIQGEANSIFTLGDIARRRFDHETAAIRFTESRALYRRCGDVNGEGLCILHLGKIAFQHADYATALAHFADALALYRKAELQPSLAETTIWRGRARLRAGETSQGRADIDAGFALYFATADARDRALPGWQALHRSLVCEDAAEAVRHREEARVAWVAIGRLDLVHDWLDLTP
jgi:tetratricopeptide (TPR) repeat protein